MLVPILASLLLAAGAPPTENLMTLNAPQHVWDVAAEDFDGNGFSDLILLCCDERSDPLKKLIAVYMADAQGRYAAEATFTCPLDAQVGVLWQAEVDGAAPRELVAASAMGAQVYQFSNGALKKGVEIEFSSLFPTRAKEPAFLKDVVADLDGDGRDEWLVPVPMGCEVWDGKNRKARIECDVVSELRRGDSVSITNRLPAVQVFDLQGNPGKALAFLSDEFADFATGANWAERKRIRIPVNVEEKWDASAKMADINADGLPDLMVTQTKGTVNLSSMTQIYIAPAAMTYAEKPTASFTSEGSIASPSLVDVDGDGKKDMAVVRIPFGVKNIVNYFMRRKVSVTAQVYLYGEKGFGAKPSFETDLTLDAPEGREEVAYTMEDFNGDKRPDLCLSETRDELVFLAGVEKGFLSAKPFARFPIPSFGRAKGLSLNANEAKDCVLIRTSGENQSRVDVMLF